MPVLERIVRPKRNRVSFEVPKEYSQCVCKVIVYQFLKGNAELVRPQ